MSAINVINVLHILTIHNSMVIENTNCNFMNLGPCDNKHKNDNSNLESCLHPSRSLFPFFPPPFSSLLPAVAKGPSSPAWGTRPRAAPSTSSSRPG